MVGRGRYHLPLTGTLALRFDALEEVVEFRAMGTRVNEGDDPRFVLAPRRGGPFEGLFHHLLLPVRVRRQIRDFKPDAVLVQGAHETALVLLGRRLALRRAKVIADVHGDWRSVTRLYGSPLRRLLDPVADAFARYGIRHADGIRTVSGYTTRIVREEGREPTAVFPAYMDLRPFLAPPQTLPPVQRVLFVGVLEAYKAIDVLALAWRVVTKRVPEAQLHLVGRGSRAEIVQKLVRDLPGQTQWTEQLDAAGVASALDDAVLLLLPSRSEGMGRVIVEALCRGRPVLGSEVGGIPDLVRDGENGVLVPPGDARALAEAIEALLTDRPRLEALAANARPSADPWLATPQEWAQRVRELVEALR
jgi:glycosyltransferase involved in cell wall biosynthesis